MKFFVVFSVFFILALCFFAWITIREWDAEELKRAREWMNRRVPRRKKREPILLEETFRTRCTGCDLQCSECSGTESDLRNPNHISLSYPRGVLHRAPDSSQSHRSNLKD